MRSPRPRSRVHAAAWLLLLGSLEPIGLPELLAADAPVAAPVPDRVLPFADRSFRFEQLTPALSRQIDAQALAFPSDPPTGRNGVFVGGLAGWIVSRTPLAAEEETLRAELALVELKERFTIAPAPDAADDVFQSLVAELPERLRPVGLEFALHLIDLPQWTAFTPGGGHLFVSRGYLEALLADTGRGRDRLAFVLAHELGHIGLGHCRRAYQLVALEQAARQEAVDEADRVRLRRLVELSVRKAGDWFTFLYSRKQDYEADLFAIHLCRNAGFDLEACLDVLRLWAVRNGRPDADATRTFGASGSLEARNGRPDVDRAVPAADNEGESDQHTFAPAVLRLKHLRHEVDGTLDGESFGLLRFDSETKRFVPLDDHHRSLPAGRRGVVLIHGMGSSLEKFVPLACCVRERDSGGRLIVFGFQYPGDASLARIGRALRREMAPFGEDAERMDFVCHSAGGLAFRWYAELEQGRFRQAVFAGTPHGGSDLARLREFLEVQQFVGDLRLGFLEAAENTILDGDGQIGHDLQPDSLFLRYLDRGTPDVARYTIFRGRRFDGRRALWLRSSAAVLRSALRRTTPESVRVGPFREETERWIERLDVPEEILNGDLAVTVDHAELEGVSRIETLRVSHHKLQRHPEIMEAVSEIVLADDVIPGNGEERN